MSGPSLSIDPTTSFSIRTWVRSILISALQLTKTTTVVLGFVRSGEYTCQVMVQVSGFLPSPNCGSRWGDILVELKFLFEVISLSLCLPFCLFLSLRTSKHMNSASRVVRIISCFFVFHSLKCLWELDLYFWHHVVSIDRSNRTLLAAPLSERWERRREYLALFTLSARCIKPYRISSLKHSFHRGI